MHEKLNQINSKLIWKQKKKIHRKQFSMQNLAGSLKSQLFFKTLQKKIVLGRKAHTQTKLPS